MTVPTSAFSSLQADITGEVRLPDPALPRGGIVSRWSELGVGMPAATVVPATEGDVVAAVKFASTHGLKVRVAGGEHSTAVPVDAECLYLDMKRFDEIRLDDTREDQEATVTLGAGVSTGALNSFLAARGLCTQSPNSNSIGTVGCTLGGGSGHLNGITGFMADCVRGFRVVTADGRVLTLSGSSTNDKERLLFRCLRGAGPGLVVVMALTLRVLRVADLQMTDGKVWMRRLIFPAAEVRAAADTWAAMHAHHRDGLPKKMQLVLAFMRAPPDSAKPCEPSTILMAMYAGPAAEGERHAAPMFEEAIVARTELAATVMVPIERMNDSIEMLNAHTGFKTTFSAFLRALEPDVIVDLFSRWRRVGDEDCPAGLPSVLVVGAWNTDALRNEGAKGETFVDHVARERGILVLAYNWWLGEAATDYMLSYGKDVLDICRRGEPVGEKLRSYANNVRYDMDMEEIYSPERIEEIRAVKRIWDEGNLFFCPSSIGISC